MDTKERSEAKSGVRNGHSPSRPFEKREGSKAYESKGRNSTHGKNAGTNRDGYRGKNDRGPSFSGGRSFDHKKPEQPKQNTVPVQKSARYVAFMALRDVTESEAYANMALDKRFGEINLSQADKRLTTSIVYSTLENLLRIDHILGFYLKDRASLPGQVIDLLRMSTAQLQFMDKLPANAVVDESVKICRYIGLEAMTGLINGVLRSMLREPEKVIYPGNEDITASLSIRYSFPKWLVSMLVEGWGEKEAEAILAYKKEKHYITVRGNAMRQNDEQFEQQILNKKVWQWEKGKVPHAYRVYGVSDLARDYDYLSGVYSVQGESSMLSAITACAKRGQNILDCCAAPGGKTAYIAEQMSGTGRIYAWDLHEHRVALLRAMMKRLQLDNIRPAVHDATVIKQDMIGTMDHVLLDAPCTGTGMMWEKPDIRMHLSEESVKELTLTQKKLLDVCCQYVKPGGSLVYSTCSILPCENAEQIKDFLCRHPEFSVQALPEMIPQDLKKQSGENGLQLLPHRDDIEGFYIVNLKRERA